MHHNPTDELDDTHLCIKCNATIVGLGKYIEHRKSQCAAKQAAATARTPTAEHSYEHGFHFAEPEAPSSHGGKTAKSLTAPYDPSYEPMGADLFFSSLQLQSVSTGGKTSAARPERAKDEPSWHASSDPLLKAMRAQEDSDFKPLKFVQTPEGSEEEDDDDDVDADDDFEGDDDDADEDYDGTRRHSPPAVPVTHTGGKWKPEHRPPQLRHTHLERLSPSWDEPAEEPQPQTEPEPEQEQEHPPAEHTHGKWVPGSKQLEYRENIDLTKLQQPHASYWCNICCRRLKTRLNYEQHLRSAYHQRRADAERQLEQATLDGASLTLTKAFQPEPRSRAQARPRLQRQRRTQLLRCELCRHSMARHLMGKHLISHYHYRRLQQQTQPRRQSALHAILEHMGSIVRQAPFQCLPCRFYANTEQAFQAHWRSASHVELTERLGGEFWCSYCQFECGSNEQMWQHLLHTTHKEVLLALNRSVPVCIAQRRPLRCGVCGERFLYNAQLRRHLASAHVDVAASEEGSAADEYQCRFRCAICGVAQRSRVALQRHEKHKHRIARYYCALCRLQFATPLEARRHRNLMQHKRHAKRLLPRRSKIAAAQPERELEQMLCAVLDEQQPEAPAELPAAARMQRCSSCALSFETPQALVEHRRLHHAMDNHACLSCGSSFQSAQALGRHTRSCQPPVASSSSSAHAASTAQSYQCDECGFSAQYKSDLLYHRFFHTRDAAIGKNELLQCPLCPKQFRKHSLRAHLRNHTDERIFECAECSTKFARRSNLKNHMASVHGHHEGRRQASTITARSKQPRTNEIAEKPRQQFQCGTCGKTLKKKSSLKDHEMMHTDLERSLRCHYEGCHYATYRSAALKTHLLSHAEGSHKCSHVNCSYVGKSVQHLKRHLNSHESERFACDQCDFKARLKGQLKRHMLRHTGSKSHKCPHCDYQCSTLDNLRNHIIKTGKHPGKFIYECAACLATDQHSTSSIFKTNSFKEYQLHLRTHKS
ncbi:hypothetical protein KR093_002923 [Drosophila rubida]|uniref:C2H2-type domain-containing protein n=1 Tax=Drosophila rubida TaxID=30044 RepID=A0AAD4K521_9MUSC|nr:hypothetical protein KR093_002923 [Drosophila rubida]